MMLKPLLEVVEELRKDEHQKDVHQKEEDTKKENILIEEDIKKVNAITDDKN